MLISFNDIVYWEQYLIVDIRNKNLLLVSFLSKCDFYFLFLKFLNLAIILVPVDFLLWFKNYHFIETHLFLLIGFLRSKEHIIQKLSDCYTLAKVKNSERLVNYKLFISPRCALLIFKHLIKKIKNASLSQVDKFFAKLVNCFFID